MSPSLQWRHNERNGASNHRRINCLLNQIKEKSSASLAFAWGIHRRLVNSPHKGPVTRKMFPFDDVMMDIRHHDGTKEGITWVQGPTLAPYEPWPLFTERRTGVSLPNLVKSPGREIGCYNDRIALKVDGHLGSAAAEVPVKFQSDWKSLNSNLAASSFLEILR